MADNLSSSADGGSFHGDELDEYRQVYLDETDEELESLVQALLTLEEDPQNGNALNEAFRLLHTMKGTSGLMGYLGVSELTHQLESRFEKIRSHEETLTRELMNLVLKATDFLRTFIEELRKGGNPSDDASALIEELNRLGQAPAAVSTAPAKSVPSPSTRTLGGAFRVRVKFIAGLQLADLKARLILARLANLGEVIGSEPSIEDVTSLDDLTQFTILFSSDRDAAEIRKIASVDGVESIEILPGLMEMAVEERRPPAVEISQDSFSPPAVMESIVTPAPQTDAEITPDLPPEAETARRAAAETVRVEVHRLDRLMNLTGELLVTNAHFAQLTQEMLPLFKRGSFNSKVKDLSDRLRQRLSGLPGQGGSRGPTDLLAEFAEDLDLLERLTVRWEEGRSRFTQIAETVDQLSRVSNNLQKRVLDTRMVPVGPLFNRFKRVVRDLAAERDKQVQLVIRGERTELDKRMIDELGDPLLHLMRNSIDHGLETSSERQRLGKPEVGTIVLEAAHRGNNVFIQISDDGAGLNIAKIRQRILERGLLSSAELETYSESQIVDFIWRPGFSTAKQITDISGRGVGMDIVKNRISELSGSIEVRTEAQRGTTFSIRLPLTLAIIRSLMIRFHEGIYSIPLDDVREIVFMPWDRIHTVHHRQTIEVRGQFIPLARMDTIFTWNDLSATSQATGPTATLAAETNSAPTHGVNVVILQSSGRTLGLCVDELLGGANIVIKSLTENFKNIFGLSGASVKGDGTVCLMLDTAAIFELAARQTKAPSSASPERVS
ncbi:chemotaxis protein CheA [Planctomicrobium piriforme]|uniref:Chemotaxis protein CheA n=1 Tax=Planctomicrobium piriforme TaxID=1576369 RepID=A0A1I3CJ43_9PLAN|nr:chemotaxis protein CheA [Planctomicrobium piriforme]SFH74594.1 two-component system, chemotaxis family, sensor kinase CheA [Planctomicrobium piriforme]